SHVRGASFSSSSATHETPRFSSVISMRLDIADSVLTKGRGKQEPPETVRLADAAETKRNYPHNEAIRGLLTILRCVLSVSIPCTPPHPYLRSGHGPAQPQGRRPPHRTPTRSPPTHPTPRRPAHQHPRTTPPHPARRRNPLRLALPHR